MRRTIFVFIAAIFNVVFLGDALAKLSSNPVVGYGYSDSKLQKARSFELKQLVLADQKDRISVDMSKTDGSKMAKEDLARRKRVGEIFSEDCLKSAEDYLAAALIYQHGNTPDNYYQAYIWSMKAAELGNKNAKAMVALTIDRYLVSIGHKQLFGSQFFSSESTGRCYCMEQVETSFPDDLRKEYLGKSLCERSSEQFLILNKEKNCPNKKCSKKLKPTPKGNVPGLW